MPAWIEQARSLHRAWRLAARYALLFLAGFNGAAAQDVPAPAEPAPVGTAELVQRLDTVNNRLLEINEYLRKPAPDLAGIAVALPGKTKEAQSVLGEGGVADLARADRVELAATLQKLSNLDRIFSKWRERLQKEITQLDPWREQLRSDAGFLREAADPVKVDPDEPLADVLPDALRTRLRDLAGELESTRKPLRKRLDVVVNADVRVGKLQSALRELQGQLDATRLDHNVQPLAITAPPLWKPPVSLQAPNELTRRSFNVLWAGFTDYQDARPAQLIAFVVILVALLIAIARLRRSILAKGETEVDELLTRYPFAVTLLAWTLLGPILLLPQQPVGLSLLLGFIDTVLLWRILPALVTPAEARPLKGLLLLGVAFLLQITLLGDDWYGRMLTVALGLSALLVFRVIARSSALEPGGRALFRRAIHGIAVVAPAVVAVGLLAEMVGARSLAQQAIGGIVFASLALCTLLAADAILRSMLDAWVAGPGARWFRSVRHWPESVRNWGHRVTRLLLVIAFAKLLPTILPALEPVWRSVGRFLTTAITVGNLQLSLGDVLWFFLGIGLAVVVARFVRFLLDEDVLPRMELALGAASAASRVIYYALVVVGIMFALAATGVELSRLTLVISALSVGIGFGLQNIVNNFVSGLILAFERPVREGDQITLGQTSGRVELIGLRATRLRTPDGAELIVPNATLISGELTNWTLSDRTRRIEIAVGVAGDSDPERVQALLLEAVADQPGVARRQAPMAMFSGFGASSLDFSLYLWTDDIDDRLAVESEARTRILAALRTAGIEIPYPRVDLRVRDALQAEVPPDAAR